MVAPSLQNVAGYKELVNYIDVNAATARLAVVANTSGVTITKGSVVYVTGASVFVPSVAKAKANDSTTMPGFGIVPADILNGAVGNCQFSGVMDNLDTSAFNAGDLLYVSAATAGVLTATAPTHPNVSQLVAIVTKKDAVTGAVFVLPGGAVYGQEAGTLKDTFKVGAGTAGAKSVLFVNAFIGTLSWTPTAARALILPDTSDTLIGKATQDTLTNKTFDSAGIGNTLKINGTAITAVTGSGAAVLADGAVLSNPTLGVAGATSLLTSGNGAFNGASLQGAYSLGSAATDPASTQTLANNLRAAIIAWGIGQ